MCYNKGCGYCLGVLVAFRTENKEASEAIPLSGHASLREFSFQHLLRHQPTTPLESGTTARDLALIQYTVGMTGPPKGVMLSHENLVINVLQRRHWMIDAKWGQDVVLPLFPLSHIYGITTGMNAAIALPRRGGSLVRAPQGA